MADLSVGGVTNATSTVSIAETDSPMVKIQKRKINLIRQEQKISEEIEKHRKFKAKQLGLPEDATWQQIEDAQQRKHEAEMVKVILEKAGVSSSQMLIMKLRKGGFIKQHIKNPTDADIIKAWNDYINREIERSKLKWA